MILVDIILVFILLLLSLPVLVLMIQVLAAIFFVKTQRKSLFSSLTATSTVATPQVVVLMPAHNEKLVIEKTIRSIVPQLGEQDRLLVVADNCTDETSTIASALGAQVLVREDKIQRGKSYALDYGIQALTASPPDIVIIVDADCIVAEGALQKLVRTCLTYKRPVQALYLMDMPENPSIKARIAQLAWIVKNKVRPTGFYAIGFPCQLMGTGMAFLWQDLMRVNLASGHIAEDMKLGADLAILQKAPMFLPEALVASVFPEAKDAIVSQRTRWEHGHLSVMLTESPRLLFEAIQHKNLQALGLFLDLIVPPLALLILVSIGFIGVLLLVNMFIPIEWLVNWALFLLALIGLSVMLAWLQFGREVISFKQLCFAPIYVFGKVSLYLKFIVNRQVEWVRSKRD
jgi:cellulose synthase/poly-beta-1,6-N-acetylglucosamine synthase-like glycosyltransferase